jgi:hypothetical protein
VLIDDLPRREVLHNRLGLLALISQTQFRLLRIKVGDEHDQDPHRQEKVPTKERNQSCNTLTLRQGTRLEETDPNPLERRYTKNGD